MIFDLHLHHLTFFLEAQTAVHMGPQAGGQLRGALWRVFNDAVCTAPSEHERPAHAQHCPACFLLELQAHSPRGQNPPRPFAVRPPLSVRAEEDRIYEEGDRFEVGITLMGKAATLFPYLVQGMHLVGQQGVGYGRGRFKILDIHNADPLTGTSESLLAGTVVHRPTFSVSGASVQKAASALPDDRVRLRFLTPTMLTHQKKTLSHPDFMPFVARLIERCQSLALHYGDTSARQETWEPLYKQLTQSADSIRCVQDNTRWVKVGSGSRRTNFYQDISGFVGEALFEGDMAPFREWLVWGQSLQVGKNTVKGNGWYEIAAG